MLKKFAITLIAISTFVYGTIFFLSQYYGTGFFDEILNQMNRVNSNLNDRQKVDHSKFILKTILEHDQPPEIWDSLIIRNHKNDHNELFYYYKIWTINSKVNAEEIESSYPILNVTDNNVTYLDMRYGKDRPVVRFPFVVGKEGRLGTGLFFPVNEEPISADYNNDGKVDHQDVLLAKEKK